VSQKSVQVAVKGEDGKVILKFDRDINYLEMEPQNTFDIAEAMCSAAFECRDGVKPVGTALKAELVERHRMRLTQRLSLVMNGSRENRTISNAKLAQQLVDICLAEVF